MRNETDILLRNKHVVSSIEKTSTNHELLPYVCSNERKISQNHETNNHEAHLCDQYISYKHSKFVMQPHGRGLD